VAQAKAPGVRGWVVGVRQDRPRRVGRHVGPSGGRGEFRKQAGASPFFDFAARLLDISRDALRYKMQKFGFDAEAES
jgi:hypothetical protein